MPQLQDIIYKVAIQEVQGQTGVEVKNITFDSRAVEAGTAFVAIRGTQTDGHQYISQAVEAGAVAVVCEELPSEIRPEVTYVLVKDTSEALGFMAANFYDNPSEKLRLVGITGTNGKTSTVTLLYRLFEKLGYKCGLLSTVQNLIHDKVHPATHTTPDPLRLNSMLAQMADAGCEFCFMEVSSHGIAQKRTAGLVFEGAVFTNLSHDHLDYHGSMKAYLAAKAMLFDRVLPPGGAAVLNADDPLVAAMASRTSARKLTFGESAGSDVRLENLELDELGRPRFDLVTAEGSAHVELTLLGEHQAHNAAATAAVAVAVGMSLDEAAAALSEARPASRWRMEVNERADGVLVINDAYNANPDSMKAALKTLAALGRGRGPDTRTIAVLGEMRELGESSREEHDAVGRLAVRLDIAQLVVVGEGARPIHLGACLEGSWAEESVFVPDVDAATSWLREHVRPGDVVLVKASRAAALERVAAALLEEDNGR